MAQVLNLNNEVVKMRRDVKKARVFIIRKLTRHVAKLKTKKGKAEDIERNLRRVERLIEEIHAMKALKPDEVTKAALQRNLIFEKVCKNPNSTTAERATARIASHPLISKKIIDIKAAIKAFKEERIQKSSESKKAPEKPNSEKNTKKPINKTSDHSTTEEEDSTAELAEMNNEEIKKEKEVQKSENDQDKFKPERTSEPLVQQTIPTKSLTPDVLQTTTAVKKGQQTSTSKEAISPANTEGKIRIQGSQSVSEESELDDSDAEEKEYFDDSTEERFYKQSSHSEDSGSEDGDGFFIGKVNKVKKKSHHLGPRQEKKNLDVKKATEDVLKKASPATHMSVDEKKGLQNSKQMKLKSVFCSTLSGSKASRPQHGKRNPHENSQAYKSTATVKNKPQFQKHKAHLSTGRFPSPAQQTQQSLHPSWEASRRRKEQQAQIMAFQGKKIKFDD
ncbi:serum response factor-binding protein 1 isoform X2 [Lepisosteus oculatus]|uniref:serum response factor-binding protein 1 isoform X2 n=1 Tax=Lepisosteus oculatus TaxID=7918 RepID=UPI00371A9087